MNLLLLLDMVAGARPTETAVQVGSTTVTAPELLAGAWAAAGQLEGTEGLVYVGTNGLAVPLGLFAAAAAGVPFIPLNYRLGAEQLIEMIERLEIDVTVIASPPLLDQLAESDRVRAIETDEFVAEAFATVGVGDIPDDGESPALLLHTSGTTAAPKAAVLRHRHLASYLVGSVEFAGAGNDEASLISVPPYHIAGVTNLLSNLYLGRRIVYLEQFDADAWVATARAEAVTNAMVVPTMLARIAASLEADGDGLPALRALSYGGSRTAPSVLERVMRVLPGVDLTNAYGLTETSSTIAVLGPDDHRAATGGDAVAVERLGSVGQVLPTVEVQVRGESGEPLGPGAVGEIWVRGEQVSGEYRGRGAPLDDDGWFPTRDRGWLDAEQYLFIEGRSDDTIIRGGENIAPAEIEDALSEHPAVVDCAVVGVPDDEWGQSIAAVVVLGPGAAVDADGLRSHVRSKLRGSKVPDTIAFVDALPYTDTGKLLRRDVLADLVAGRSAD